MNALFSKNIVVPEPMKERFMTAWTFPGRPVKVRHDKSDHPCATDNSDREIRMKHPCKSAADENSSWNKCQYNRPKQNVLPSTVNPLSRI
jgi:hypothetical protein